VPIGPGGAITPVANPAATAGAMARLLADPKARAAASDAIRTRVRSRFLKSDCDSAYRALYERAVALQPA
jgi:glycosyltransferase involved in cell wall biosynthesis